MLRRRKSGKGGVLVPLLIAVGTLFLILMAVGIFLIIWLVKTQIFGFLGATGRGYIRIAVSPEKTVWLQFEGEQIRTASSAEALEEEEWQDFVYDKDEGKKLSPALALPLEKEDPHGWDKAEICFAPLGPYYYAHWYLSKTDSAGSRWTYKFEKFVQPDESLSLAPKIEVPNLDDPVLEVTLKAESDQDHAARKPTNLTLGVAVVLKSGDENRFYKEILKDGTVVSVHARLVDGEGSLVESIEKPLSELGFT